MKALSTYEKALAINLEQMIYGTFAEIGAGQEIARWFFQVGGAAGTVAKTMSAYDMKYSDAIYGHSTRYVSRPRLEAMLKHEADLLKERLGESRGKTSKFFALADTISARNYRGDNECHGWLGVRFQCQPLAPWSDVELHVNLHDKENSLQQDAVGILGVNLLHAAFFHLHDTGAFLKHLMDGLSLRRVEIDVVKISDSGTPIAEELSCGLAMLREGLSRVVIIDKDHKMGVPSELFHNRPLVIERGAFRQKVALHKALLQAADRKLRATLSADSKEPVALFGLSTHEGISKDLVSPELLSERANSLLSEGVPILISDFPEAFKLSELLRRYSNEPIAFVLGLAELMSHFCESSYRAIDGGILEVMSRFMAGNCRVLCAATPREQFLDFAASAGFDLNAWDIGTDKLVSTDTVSRKDPVGHLFRYLVEKGAIQSF